MQTLEDETGVAGEIDVTVRADDITRPEVVSWMSDYQQQTLEGRWIQRGRPLPAGQGPARAVSRASPCPRFSARWTSATRRPVKGLLDAVPAYFAQGVVSPDRTRANLAFGIRLQSLQSQQEVMER